MITITITIKDNKEDGSSIIGFSAHDEGGCTDHEGDVADAFRRVLIETREKIYEALGITEVKSLRNVYARKFDDPNRRDKNAEEQNET